MQHRSLVLSWAVISLVLLSAVMGEPARELVEVQVRTLVLILAQARSAVTR